MRLAAQCSIVCVSRLTAERSGRFKAVRKAIADLLSFIAGPPTKLKPVRESTCETRGE